MKKLLAVIGLSAFVAVGSAFMPSPLIDMNKVKIAVNAPEKAKVNGEFTVELTLNKEGESGFCKLEHVIPEGFIASEVESNGSVFVFEKQTVKFIWLKIPANNQVKVKYKVKVDSSVVPGKFALAGSFAYTENKKVKKVEAPKWNMLIEK
jgi:hypothetical protein